MILWARGLLPARDVILLGEFDRGFYGFRSTTHIDDAREPPRRQRCDFGGELDGWLGQVAARPIVQRAGLLVDRARNLLVAVAKRVRPAVAAHHVEIGVAVNVDDMDPGPRSHDHRSVFFDIVARGDRKNAVIERVLRQAVGAFDRGFRVHEDSPGTSARV